MHDPDDLVAVGQEGAEVLVVHRLLGRDDRNSHLAINGLSRGQLAHPPSPCRSVQVLGRRAR
jgi:hypothetical protein